MRSELVAIAACALAAAGCAKSFASAPPLSYAKLPYTSVEGEAWPTKSFAVTGLRAKHPTLARDPHATYVELNPEGERTIIFLHGLGSYSKFWRYQLDRFAEQGYRVIALDMIGFGKSDKPSGFSYTTEAMAEVVLALLRHARIERPVLVGHSMGGQVALSFAIRHPQEAAGLVLVSPAGFEAFSVREKKWFEKVFNTNFVESTTEYDLWGNIRYQNFSRWSSDYEWLLEERVRTAKDPEFSRYAYAQVKSVRGLADNDFVRTSLDKVKVPTLIAFGDEDRLIPNPYLHGGTTRSVMELGHEGIAGSKLVELDGCGHTLQIDCADQLNPLVLEFLAGLPPAAATSEEERREPAKEPSEPDAEPDADPKPDPTPEPEVEPGSEARR